MVTVALVAVVVAVTALEAAFVLTEALVAALVVVRTPNGDWLNPAKEIPIASILIIVFLLVFIVLFILLINVYSGTLLNIVPKDFELNFYFDS